MDDLRTVVVAQHVLDIVGPDTSNTPDVRRAVVGYSASDAPIAGSDDINDISPLKITCYFGYTGGLQAAVFLPQGGGGSLINGHGRPM